MPAEYEEVARRGFSDEDAMRWARDDYLRDEMVWQRRALEEIAARGRDARIRAISARRAAPVGGGGTGTPPALILHALGTRMSGGTGYSASKRSRASSS